MNTLRGPWYRQLHWQIFIGMGLGLVAGYLTMAILATSLHTAPMPRSFAGFDPGPDNRMFFKLAPDRQWLAFTQYVSEHSMRIGRGRLFDGAQFRLVEPSGRTEAAPVPIWSSFPIRYAHRREQFSSGAGVAGGAPGGPPQNSPPPTVTPGGDSGAGGF